MERHAGTLGRTADGGELMTGPDSSGRNVAALRGTRRTKDLPPPPPLPVPQVLQVPEPTYGTTAGPDHLQERLVGQGAEEIAATRGRPDRGSSRTPAAQRTSRRAKTRSVAKLAEDDTRPVAAYLPHDLKTEVVSDAQRAGQTLAEWLLDAYDRVFERLDSVLADDAGNGQPRRSGLPQRRVRRRSGAVTVQAQFYLTGTELRVLDEHRERLGVESRTEFFTVIAQLGVERRS